MTEPDRGPGYGRTILAEEPRQPETTQSVPGRPLQWGHRGEAAALGVCAVVAIAVPAAAALDVSFPGRTVLAVAFVLMVPGVPLASLLRVPNAVLAGCLAGGISLATALLGATVQLTIGWWHPVGWAAAVAAVSLGATGAVLVRQSPVGTGHDHGRRVRRGRCAGLAVGPAGVCAGTRRRAHPRVAGNSMGEPGLGGRPRGCGRGRLGVRGRSAVGGGGGGLPVAPRRPRLSRSRRRGVGFRTAALRLRQRCRR